MATVITKLTNGNVKIVYSATDVRILNPCANIVSDVVNFPDCVGIETNGGKLHLIDWLTVDTQSTTKAEFAEELGTDYFFDLTQTESEPS